MGLKALATTLRLVPYQQCCSCGPCLRLKLQTCTSVMPKEICWGVEENGVKRPTDPLCPLKKSTKGIPHPKEMNEDLLFSVPSHVYTWCLHCIEVRPLGWHESHTAIAAAPGPMSWGLKEIPCCAWWCLGMCVGDLCEPDCVNSSLQLCKF